VPSGATAGTIGDWPTGIVATTSLAACGGVVTTGDGEAACKVADDVAEEAEAGIGDGDAVAVAVTDGVT